jgi:hypothetical protein
VTYLFTLMFFAMAIGVAVAAIWSTVDESRDYVVANLPRWMRRRRADGPAPVLVRHAFQSLAHA